MHFQHHSSQWVFQLFQIPESGFQTLPSFLPFLFDYFLPNSFLLLLLCLFSFFLSLWESHIFLFSSFLSFHFFSFLLSHLPFFSFFFFLHLLTFSSFFDAQKTLRIDINADQPEAVSNCSVKNQSLTSLLVTCNPGDSGGLRQTFFLEVLDSLDHSLHSNITAQESPIFLVMDLKANSKYTLLVYATNLKGRSSPVVLKAPLSTKYEKQTHRKCIHTHTLSLSSFLLFLSFFFLSWFLLFCS